MNHTHRHLLDSTVCPPLVATLLYGEYMAEILPKELHGELNQQSRERRELLQCIDTIGAASADPIDLTKNTPTTLEQIEHATSLYTRLCDFIESDTTHQRIVLYLPFELLPDYSFRSSSRRLNSAIKRFVTTYLHTWRLLLDSLDIRTNFSNGDIIESEYESGVSPCVSKAAHLIPVLVQKNLITINEVFALIEGATNTVVKNSIADSMGVLADMDLLSREDLEKMRISADPLLSRLFLILNDEKSERRICAPCISDMQQLFQQQSVALKSIDERFFKSVTDSTLRRCTWERDDAIEAVLTTSADHLVDLMKGGHATVDQVTILITETHIAAVTMTGLISLRKFCEYLFVHDPEMARCYTGRLLPYMKVLYKTQSLDIQQCLEVTLYHWCNIGLIAASTVLEFDVKPRDLKKGLEGTLSKHEKTIMEKLWHCISNHTILSQYVYPIVAVYGSKVKGYALGHTDNDIAFFIKPEVSFSDRNKVQNMLSEVLRMCGIQATPLEVWLEENNYSLQIRDIDGADGYIAQSSMVYVLFQSIWIGDMNTIQDLYQDLILAYLTTEYRHDDSNRTIWVREMERDMLQYRLLHKGYARLYPTYSPFVGKHASDIDGDSTFWDSGYRKVATKLFISNVYLPLLK